MKKKMRYYLIDNGEGWSDHEIHFVKSEWGDELVAQCVRINEDSDFAKILFVFASPPLRGAEGWKVLEDYCWFYELVEHLEELPTGFLLSVRAREKKNLAAEQEKDETRHRQVLAERIERLEAELARRGETKK